MARHSPKFHFHDREEVDIIEFDKVFRELPALPPMTESTDFVLDRVPFVVLCDKPFVIEFAEWDQPNSHFSPVSFMIDSLY